MHHPEAANEAARNPEEARGFMVHRLKIDDFDTWKSLFDEDPVGRNEAAKGHIMLRGLDNPNEVFTRVEFDSVEGAKSFSRPSPCFRRARRTTVLTPPTVVELVENITY